MMHETAKSMIKNAIYAAGSRPWRVRRLRRELRDIDRVHAGCGVYRVNGWLNIELMSLHEISYGKVVYQGKAMLLNFDLTKGIPIADNQVSYLYSSHFIEHLSLDQGRAFLSVAFGS